MRRPFLISFLAFVSVLAIGFTVAVCIRSQVDVRTGNDATVEVREINPTAPQVDQAKVQAVFREAVIQPLIEAERSGQPLIEAARNGQVGTVEELLRHTAPNGRDQAGRTALHHAAMNGHAYTVEKLVQHGAEINALDNEGKTPLHLAAERGHSDMVKTLLRLGARQNIRDNAGLTAGEYALRGGHTQTAGEFTFKPNAPVMMTTVIPLVTWAAVLFRLMLIVMAPILIILLIRRRRLHRRRPLLLDQERLEQLARLAERMEARIANLETILTAQESRGQAVGK